MKTSSSGAAGSSSRSADKRTSWRTGLLAISLVLATVGACGCSLSPSSALSTSDCPNFSGPITITSGGTYIGCWESPDFGTPAVRISTTEPVVIENSIVRAPGKKIATTVEGADVTVRDSKGYGLNPNIAGASTEYFFYSHAPKNVRIVNNYLEGTPGIWVGSYGGNYTPEQTIKVLRNQALNIDGRRSDGAGGYRNAYQRLRQFLQLDHVQNVPNVEVGWNEIFNEPGKSGVEDNINIYMSSGTPSSPINIHDNYIDGAYPATGIDATFTGGGILGGDGDAPTKSEVPAYVRVHHNQVLDTTNYGVAVANGHHIELDHNRTVGDSNDYTARNVGMFCWNGGGHDDNRWNNNSIHDNKSAWISDYGGATHRNDYWVPDCHVSTNNESLPTVDEAAEWGLWQKKLDKNGIVLGP